MMQIFNQSSVKITLAQVQATVSAYTARHLAKLVRRVEKGIQRDWSSCLTFSAGANKPMGQPTVFQDKIALENRPGKDPEKEIQKLQNHVATIIDAMPSVVIGVDGGIRITLWNIKAEESTGISGSDACGRPLIDVFPRIGPQVEQIQRSLHSKTILRIPKTTHILEDSSQHYEDMAIYPLTGDDEGAIIRIDDVTEKVRIQEMLIQNEKMLSIGELAAGMAHEINNPLAGIIQNTAVLSNRLTDMGIPANIKAASAAGISMESVHRFMDIRDIPHIMGSITQSSLRMASIVENMLSFSRKSDASFSCFDLAALMDKSLELAASNYNLKKHYDFKSINIQKHYEPDLPEISCDGGKIQQVLLNILNNGAQAMFENAATPRRKPIFNISIHRDLQRGMVRMEIKDNGPGMDEMTSKRIFEPFFTTKPPGIGTGLGLSVSYFIIVENHGGTLNVVTEKGQGSTFIIRLPSENNAG
ncbi:MAG: ATP-binding protein [Pseudomonadota bacterium]